MGMAGRTAGVLTSTAPLWATTSPTDHRPPPPPPTAAASWGSSTAAPFPESAAAAAGAASITHRHPWGSRASEQQPQPLGRGMQQWKAAARSSLPSSPNGQPAERDNSKSKYHALKDLVSTLLRISIPLRRLLDSTSGGGGGSSRSARHSKLD